MVDKSVKKIMIIAGGTGGHVFPGLAVAHFLLKNGYNVVWLGTVDNIEAKLVPSYGIEIKFIYIKSGFGKKIYKKVVLLFFLILFALYQSIKIIKCWKPDVVLSMGGYISGPSGVAVWLHGIPLIIHEQNRVIGLTNRFLCFFSKKVLQGFPDTIPDAVTVGNPIRSRILSLPNPESRWKDRTGPIRILVIGGSQGANIFNRIIPKVAKILADKLIIWHQSGIKDFNNVKRIYHKTQTNYYKIESFVYNIEQAYLWADLVISRSGALTVSEIACVGLPAIFVPFMYHKDRHQYYNAESLQQIGAAKIIEEQKFTINYLSTILESLNREQLLDMAKKAKNLAMPNATQLVVKTIVRYLK